MTHPASIPLLERFFRSAAGAKVDRDDVRRLCEFVDEQVDRVSVAGRDAAKRNDRAIIEPQDLPVTRGIHDLIREFDERDEADEVRELVRQSLRQPPADVRVSDNAERLLVDVFGGLCLALARSFRVIDPTAKVPSTEHWGKAIALFRMVL